MSKANKGGWISLKSPEKPAQNQAVWICEMDAINDYCVPYNYEDAVQKAFYSKGKFFYDDWEREHHVAEDVTHWQPMPESPEG